MQAVRHTLLLSVLALVIFSAQFAAAEYRFETGIAVSEEFNDNVFLMPANTKTDYITRVLPSFHLVYAAPAWDWDFSYTFDYRYYAKDTRKHDSTQDLRLVNHTSIVQDTLFLDVRDRFYRTSLDTVRDYTTQSIFLNQTDVNEFLVTPYVKFNLTSHTSGTVGYEYRNVWYRETTGINKWENWGFLDLRDELSERTALTAGTRAVYTDASNITYRRVDAYAGPRYEYAPGSSFWAIVGNSWFDWNRVQTGTQFFWDVGVTHRMVSYSLTVDTALTYVDDPQRIQRREDRYRATFLKETDRMRLSLIAGLWEYRNILTKHLQDSRIGLAGSIGYSFSPAFRGTYGFNVDRYEDNVNRTYSMVYVDTVSVEYEFPASTLVTLAYSFNHGYSPDPVNFLLNYDNNRVVLEIRKIF